MSVEKFRNYLLFKKFVTEKQIPYYVQWVTMFLQFCNSHKELSVPEKQLNGFLSDMEKKREQWQVDQAREAVSLYRFFIDRRNPSVAKTREWNREWVESAEMMKRMLRLKQLSYRTEQSYMAWLRRFYKYTRPETPASLDDSHLKDFLSYLASDCRVAKATQNQAFNALLFFYRHVLEREVGSIADAVRSRRGRRLPVVLTKDEVLRLIGALDGIYALVAQMI